MNYNFTWVEPMDENKLIRQADQEICYDDLGCFSMNHPWVSRERPITFSPQSPEVINTRFYLSTRLVETFHLKQLIKNNS